MSKEVYRSEDDLLVFISSKMNAEMEPARKIAVEAIEQMEFVRPWAFEHTPASAETAEDNYLRKVREADFVLWLVGAETTQPVVDEVNEAISSDRKLLVFKLPAEQRDFQTQDLLDRVGTHVKWRVVDSIENLPAIVSQSVADAIIHSVRNPLAPARRRKLLQDIRLSVARCKEQLLSLGVEECAADEMANDREGGNVLDTPASGAWSIVGEQGCGKSLAVERLFQRVAMNAVEDSSRPFPISVRARDLRGPLTKHIEECLQGYADPYDPRVLLIVDGVDELGSNRATDIYRQVTAYSDANPEAILILTTRELPGIGITGQQIRLDPLQEEESLSLMQKVLGRPIEARDMHRWPRSIREARRIPLFAVMLGGLLRHNPDLSLATSGEVIGQVANQLLMHEEDHPEELDWLLQTLAFKAIESGTRVDPNEITTVRAKQALLQGSRAVEGTIDSLDFALPVFREWYAARALIEGTMSIDHLKVISDRWLPSLSVVLASGVDEVGEAVLAYIVSSDPGLAGTLLKENTPDRIQFHGKIPAVRDSQSVGTKIRKCMGLWKAGLDDLYLEIGPANAEEEISTLAVEKSERYLNISWYAGQSTLANVVELRDYLPDGHPDVDWPIVWGWEMEPGLVGPSWWSYFGTQKELSDSLARVLGNYSLASKSVDYRRELTWNFALDIWQRGELQEYLGIDRVLEYLNSLNPNTTVRSYRGKEFGPRELDIVAQDLSAMVKQGESEVASPWPNSDLPIVSGSIWEFYSDERLLERTKEIYSGALRIYVSIVERWFPGFCRRLPLYRMLPVKLEGWVKPGRKESERGRGPTLDWHVRIMPESQQNEVLFELDLGLTDTLRREFIDRGDHLYEEQKSVFEALRPDLPGAFSMTLTSSGLSELWDPYPATELAHRWLRSDLRELGW